jgi:multidrug resistance efflux pump
MSHWKRKSVGRTILLSATSATLIAGILSLHESHAEVAPAAAGAPTPQNVLLLGAAVSGVIQKIDVVDGRHVSAGQLLIQIDCRPLEEQVKVRTSALAASQAAFDRARKGSRPEQIASGEAEVGVSRARAEEAQDAYARLSRLTPGITVTQQELFKAQRETRIGAAQLEDSEKRLALLEAGSRPEDIAEAHANRDEAQSLLDETRAELDQCSVRAPSPGIVKTLVTVGEFVSTSVPETLIRLTVPIVNSN